MKMKKLLRMIAFLALIGLLGVMGGCNIPDDCDTEDPENLNTPYPIVNVPGAILPANPANWTASEKQAWIDQASLLMDQICSDEDFRGRMTGDIGHERAAIWAAASFKDWGLEPLDGSYFQTYPFSYTMPTGPTVIKILVDGVVRKETSVDYINEKFVKDFQAAHMSNTGTARGKVSFLGYGIDATAANTFANDAFAHINAATVYRNDFNEYVGLTWGVSEDSKVNTPTKTLIDVTDRIVIFRNSTPNGLMSTVADYRLTPLISAINTLDMTQYRFTVGNDWIRHDEHFPKVTNARTRGAQGVLYNQMVSNPSFRYQPPVTPRPFVIAHVGSVGRNTSTGALSETSYTNGGGESRILNDLFSFQLEIEGGYNPGVVRGPLNDLLWRAAAVKQPNATGTGSPRAIPRADFGDGNGPVNDYVMQLYYATQDLFQGPVNAVNTYGGQYDQTYDASIATNSFNFSDRIELEVSTVADTGLNVGALNVVGMIKGSEFPDEYVIYHGHYDHVGIVYPFVSGGAADNGGGSTAVMIAARYAAQMAASGNRPKRSLVFALDSSEEAGLFGAQVLAKSFADKGKEKVKGVFLTDSTFGRGTGDITLTTSCSSGMAPFIDLILNSSQGRHHPWGQDATGLFTSNAGDAIIIGTPAVSSSLNAYIGRPRDNGFHWLDYDMPVRFNVSASQGTAQTRITSVYHANYNDREYVGDHLLALLGIATAQNMYTVANQP